MVLILEVWWGCGGSGVKAVTKVGFKNIFSSTIDS
jgi:hypothetical protein